MSNDRKTLLRCGDGGNVNIQQCSTHQKHFFGGGNIITFEKDMPLLRKHKKMGEMSFYAFFFHPSSLRMGVGCPNPPVPGAGGCAAVAGAAVGAAAEAAAADVGLPYAPTRGFDGFWKYP